MDGRRTGMIRGWARVGCRVAWVMAACMAVAWKAVDWVPMPTGLDGEWARGTAVDWVDRYGATLRASGAEDGPWRRELAEGDIPESVVRCTLAAEDARFFGHGGVDVLATERAAWQWARNGRVISGASTITQQRVKLGHPRPRTLWTKVVEATQAMRLERAWDKQRILRSYLARVDYGNRAEGLAAAARHYFGKAPRDLSWAEAAMLAGLPQAPTRLNPRLRMDRAKARQEWILGRCVKLGWLDEATARRAAGEELRLVPCTGPWTAPHFVEVVRARHGSDAAGRVMTTLDAGLQSACEGIVRARLAELSGRRVRDAAMVVIEHATGEVRAWVGSPDWSRADGGQVDGVLARRSPGSALKPFAYLRAFEGGAMASDVVADVPMRVWTDTGLYEPRNYDGRFRGPVSLREALAGSLNIPAVRVLEGIGGAEGFVGVMRGFGMETGGGRVGVPGLGVVLGEAEVRLVELANAYATLARMGWWIPWRVTPGDPVEGRRVADAGACWLVADVLSDPLARAAEFGMQSVLSPGMRVACKTGTSTGFRDNWALGYTPRFTAGVWAGNFDGTPMAEVSGVSGAGVMLGDVLMELSRRHGDAGWFEEPAGLTRARVEPLSGRRRRGVGEGREEVFLAGTRPGWERDGDRDVHGRVVLGLEYREWMEGEGARMSDRMVVKEGGGPGMPVVITPVAGTRYVLDGDAAEGTQRVMLRASGGTDWTSPTLRLERHGEGVEAVLEPGRHVLRVQGRGGWAETWIEVRRR